jgi:hypothetical protein
MGAQTTSDIATADRWWERPSDEHLRAMEGIRRWADEFRPTVACPCCGLVWPNRRTACPTAREAASGYMRDAKWFKEHPDERWHLRELSVAEQLDHFLGTGQPATHVRVQREDWPVRDRSGNLLRTREHLYRWYE